MLALLDGSEPTAVASSEVLIGKLRSMTLSDEVWLEAEFVLLEEDLKDKEYTVQYAEILESTVELLMLAYDKATLQQCLL